MGRLQRLGALRLLARAARHRPGADHGLAGDPRPRRRAGGRPVRQAPPQERAAVAGLAGSSPASCRTPRSRTRRGSGGARSSSCTQSRSYPPSCSTRRSTGAPAGRRASAAETRRGRRRNLTAILRRARLSKAQRRSRGITRRRELARHAERQRVRAQVADSLADAAKTHVTHPFGASTTSRTSLEEISQDETFNRRLTGARARLSEIATALQTSTTGSEKNQPRTGEELRWAVYNEVKGQRFERTDQEWAPFLRSPARRLEQLLVWPESTPLPRWRLIEAWTVAAHGPYMAVAGGFRLAFWSEDARHHGPRLDRALARYARYADARPAGFPAAPVAAFARFLAEHTPRQDGPGARDGLRRAALQRADQANVAPTPTTPATGTCSWPRRAPGAASTPASSPSSSTASCGCGSAPATTARAAGCGSPPSCSTPTTRPTRPPAKRSTRPPSGQSGSSSATSGCGPASTRATRTAATAPPAPTPSGGASRCRRDGGRRASRAPGSTRAPPAPASPRRARR